MFARISTFTLLALPILATATAVLPRADGGACGASGTVQCCNSTQNVSLPPLLIRAMLNIPLAGNLSPDVTTILGSLESPLATSLAMCMYCIKLGAAHG